MRAKDDAERTTSRGSKATHLQTLPCIHASTSLRTRDPLLPSIVPQTARPTRPASLRNTASYRPSPAPLRSVVVAFICEHPHRPASHPPLLSQGGDSPAAESRPHAARRNPRHYTMGKHRDVQFRHRNSGSQGPRPRRPSSSLSELSELSETDENGSPVKNPSRNGTISKNGKDGKHSVRSPCSTKRCKRCSS